MKAGRTWLRERGPVTLAAALLLEVSSATPASGPVLRALLRAVALVLFLFVVLIAAALDGLLSRLVDGARAASMSVERWTRTSVLGERAPVPIPDALLLDRAGRPLRGGARNARIAAIVREQERDAGARSIRGRAVVAYARARSVARPYLQRLAARAAALEARAIAARAAAIAESRATLDQLRPRVVRALAPLGVLSPLRARATRLLADVREEPARRAERVRSTTAPALARLRRDLALRATALALSTARAALVVRLPIAAVPVPSIPLPRLSLATVRVVTVGVLLSFVFATVIGTTGLVANRGAVALGASTTLAIISGEVTVLDPGAADFRVAADGEVLQAGMTIQTAAETYAILTYFEGSTVSIDPETTLVIEALHANPDGSTVIGMRQEIGRTWHAVAKLLTAGSKYEVRTPTATASVRGTLFLVGVLPSADLGVPETVIETTEGAVAAERAPTPETPQGEEIIVPAGFTVTAKPAQAIPPPVPAPEPERKVTVTVGAANSLVVDPQGRANGERDGKIVVQTPGATVEKVDGKIVVTLPNISDGKVSTVIQPATQPADAPPQPPAAVEVVTVVAERGKSDSTSTESVTPQGNAPGVTGVELKKSADPDKPADLRKLDETEKQEAPTPKVAELPKPPAEPKQERSPEGDGDKGRSEGEGDDDDEDSKRKGVVQSIVTLTLPPLSAEELARREEEKRKSDERAREEQRRRDDERRAADEKRIQELRQAEERAKANVTRIGDERQREEENAQDRRRSDDDRREEGRREDERAGTPTPEPPVAVIQQIIRAITPDSDGTKRDEDKKIDELRRAEEKAKEEAKKAEDERRRAEERARAEAIKAEEEKKKEAEKRSGELRRAEERAKQDEARKLEELRRIEEKAREQTATLELEQRRAAERRLEEFREAEERKRREESRQREEQRRAEERAREDAEQKLRELRREEERARGEQKEREEERKDRDRDERRDRRGGFAPTETLKPLPGVGSRSADEEDRSGQRRDADERSPSSLADRDD